MLRGEAHNLCLEILACLSHSRACYGINSLLEQEDVMIVFGTEDGRNLHTLWQDY
jgi:hypothetical protein